MVAFGDVPSIAVHSMAFGACDLLKDDHKWLLMRRGWFREKVTPERQQQTEGAWNDTHEGLFMMG
jgi:hypothetical protein